MTALVLLWCCCVTAFSLFGKRTSEEENPDTMSAVMKPRVPNCKSMQSTEVAANPTIPKILICTIFKNEEGFLAEFVSFYKVLGVSHVMLFDHHSSDNSSFEIAHWVSTGFASVVSVDMLLTDINMTASNSSDIIRSVLRKRQESYCISWAMRRGFDYFISVDVNEYIFPMKSKLSLPAAADQCFKRNNRLIMFIPKFSFNSAPHILEPIDLLTIEAYQTRYEIRGQVNHYMSIQPSALYKVAIINTTASASEADEVAQARTFLRNCCGFRGCELRPAGQTAEGVDCRAVLEAEELAPALAPRFHISVSESEWRHVPKISLGCQLRANYYARSLEKYSMKMVRDVMGCG